MTTRTMKMIDSNENCETCDDQRVECAHTTAERERRRLRLEFPGLHDAELGIEPIFGWDSDGTPIY